MAIWLAAGPTAIVCVAPSTVCACTGPSNVCTTPCETSRTASTSESGTSTYSVPRTRSAQKLPMVPLAERAMPRTSATATAMPTAAETKFCVASPTIWVRYDIVCSGV